MGNNKLKGKQSRVCGVIVCITPPSSLTCGGSTFSSWMLSIWPIFSAAPLIRHSASASLSALLWDKKLPMPPPLPPPFWAPGEVSGPDHARETESVTDPNTKEAPIAVKKGCGGGQEGQQGGRRKGVLEKAPGMCQGPGDGVSDGSEHEGGAHGCGGEGGQG